MASGEMPVDSGSFWSLVCFKSVSDTGVVEAALNGLNLIELPTPDGNRAALTVEVAAFVLVVLQIPRK